MADRTYIIEVLLEARDNMARAFAEATGEIEAYDKLLDEQTAKTKKAQESQKDYAKSLEDGTTATQRRKQSIADLNETYDKLNIKTDQSSSKQRAQVTALKNLEAAQQRVTLAQQRGQRGTTEYATATNALEAAQRKFASVLQTNQGIAESTAKSHAKSIQQQIALNQTTEATIEVEGRLAKQREQILQKATRPANVLADPRSTQRQEVDATKQLSSAYQELRLTGLDASKATERLDNVQKEALKSYGFTTKAARNYSQELHAQTEAMDLYLRKSKEVANATVARPASTEATKIATGPAGTPHAGKQTELAGVDVVPNLGSAIAGLQGEFGNLQNSANGFASHVRNIFGVTLVTALQPFSALLVGLVGTYGSLASAALAAGSAIQTTFLSSIAQGVPVMGLFSAAMDRLRGVMGLVSGEAAVQQQRFVAQYQAAYQNRLGINQVTIAQHQYSDALFAVGQAQLGVIAAGHQYSDSLFAENQAVFQVKVSELALLQTRQQATRQLQQLILQEQQAKLAAQASSLAVTDAQKALQQAIATGGDVQAAQLQVSQAQVSHHAAVVQAQQSITDAARGSIARQGIQQQVDEASRAVTQARHSLVDAQFATVQARNAVVAAQRSVVDAQFSAQQARAAIVQAQQAQQGFNIATAAQLAYLRSQMTETERSLASNILKIFNLFRGAHGILTPMTDAILRPFVGITNEIFKLLHDPRLTGALQGLADAMGSAISKVSNAFLGNTGISRFISFINAATANMRPLATIITNLFNGIGSVLQVAIPYVHQFAGFIAQLTGQFSSWANSQKGKNWLRDWFNEAYKALEQFIGVGVSVGKLIAAVVGTGGGAQAGINLLKDFQKHIDGITSSIDHHGRSWHTLQDVWAAALPALRAIHTIASAVVGQFIALGASAQGQAGIQNLAHLVANVLVPAFGQFASNMGQAITAVTQFLNKNPAIEGILKNLIAFSLTAHIGFRALGILIGPLTTIVQLVGNAVPAFKALHDVWVAMPEEVAAVAGPIGIVVAAVVAIAAATHNLGKLISEVLSPFKLVWKDISQAIQPLIQAIKQVGDAVGIHLGKTGAHKIVSDLLTVLGVLLRLIATSFIQPIAAFVTLFATGIKHIIGFIKDIVGVFKDVFKLIGDVIHGRWGSIVGDFKQIGKDIWNALWSALTFIPDLLINLFKSMVRGVENFLGISSPSKKFKSIGDQIWNGLWSAVKSIPTLFLHLAEDAAKFFLKGIENLPGDVLKKLGGPLSNLVSGKGGGGGGVLGTLGGAAQSFFSGIAGIQVGGPIPGFGGGDRHLRRLEGGEHVLTKDEVKAAGGHGAIFAMRRALGGGGQGGPFGFAVGGAVSTAQTALSQSKTSTTELQYLNQYVQKYLKEINYFWQQMNSLNKENLATQLKEFHDNFNSIQQQLQVFTNKFQNTLQDFWQQTNTQQQNALDTFLKNFRWTYNKVDTDTFNAFWYIQHAANQSLKAFGAKQVDVTLGAQPKFAGGGYVGEPGERGKDAVHAVLGRGEAVLNYAHQRVVEPAMRAFYGWGLGDMFDKVRATHAGYTTGLQSGFAKGGYVFPFSGSGWGWDRTDQGVDFGGNAPIGAIGNATVTYSNPSDGWYSPAPAFMVYRLDDGPMSGRYIYVAEHINRMAPAGSRVPAGHAVAQMVGGIETGWAAGPKGHQIIEPHGADHLTQAGQQFHAFLTGLAHGKIVGGAFGGAGSVGASWNDVKKQSVHGSGVMAELLKAGIKKVLDAANKYGEKKAAAVSGSGQGIGSVPTGLNGSVMRQIFEALSKLGWNKVAIAGAIGNAVQESDLSPGIFGGGAAGLWQWTPPDRLLQAAAKAHVPWQSVGLQAAQMTQEIGRAGVSAMNAAKTPAAAAQWLMANWERPLVATENLPRRIAGAEAAFKAGFAKGGFAGDAIPVMAHVGEWIVNQTQQSKLARALGTSVGRLRGAMGFTGGPYSFAGGGEVQHYATGRPPQYRSTAPEPRSSAPDYATIIPPPSPTGGYTLPSLTLDLPGFLQQTLAIYNQAQKIVLRIREDSKKFNKSVGQFLTNFNLVGGSDGLFAQAAQAIQDFATNESSAVQLTAAGFRAVINKATGLIQITKSNVQNAVQAAQTDLSSTDAQIKNINALNKTQQTALKAVERELKKLGKPTADNLKQYQQLIGARQTLITDINTQDQNLAQAYSDRYNKQVTLFQAQTAALLRGTTGDINKPGGNTTLSTKQVGSVDLIGGPGQRQSGLNNLQGIFSQVGPAITQGLASMVQTIAQTFGDPQQIQQADKYVLQAAQQQQKDLQAAYAAAAAKAKKDPRWQSVADDLLSQLESATTAVAQAQAQALTDAITAVQNQAAVQNAGIQLQQTMAQALGATSSAFGPANQYAAIGQQIGISQQNAGNLSGQLAQYGALYNTAAAQGNVGAMQQLTQTMDELKGEIAQANVQTQQLITQYQQLSVTIQQTIASGTSNLNQSATGIFQVIGQILGNQNLPALISAAQELGQSLVQSGQQAIQNIRDAMNSTAFGGAQGGANTLLSQAINAFNQGPQAYAGWLAANAPQISTFAAGLPSDQATLFNGLIQSLTDNTTAVVNNTLNLQQLNATTNQQQFTSSAWTMFRQAIFTGIGTLLPQFAMAVPSLDVGGTLTRSGLIYAHKGEAIQPASVKMGEVPGKVVNNENHFHIDHPMEVADPVHFGNQVGWRLSHDPNSR